MPRQMLFVMAVTVTTLALVEVHSRAAHAQAARPDPAAMFDRTDANKDGKISRGEYVAARSSRFDTLDHDKDGVVSKADFPRAAANPQTAARLDALLSEADTNHDGKVTRTELGRAPSPGFDRADTNRDGVVTRTELAALRAKTTR